MGSGACERLARARVPGWMAQLRMPRRCLGSGRTHLQTSSEVDGLNTRPDLQPAARTSESERSMWPVASGWKVMKSAPASAKSPMIASTGDTIRCTSIGALMP